MCIKRNNGPFKLAICNLTAITIRESITFNVTPLKTNPLIEESNFRQTISPLSRLPEIQYWLHLSYYPASKRKGYFHPFNFS